MTQETKTMTAAEIEKKSYSFFDEHDFFMVGNPELHMTSISKNGFQVRAKSVESVKNLKNMGQSFIVVPRSLYL